MEGCDANGYGAGCATGRAAWEKENAEVRRERLLNVTCAASVDSQGNPVGDAVDCATVSEFGFAS